jgi:hypothetical protein
VELHEIKKNLHNKRNVSKLKRLPTEWERIFASYTFEKGLIPKYTGAQKTKLPQKSMTH